MACHIVASPLRGAPDAIELKIVHYENGQDEIIGTATIELIDAAE